MTRERVRLAAFLGDRECRTELGMHPSSTPRAGRSRKQWKEPERFQALGPWLDALARLASNVRTGRRVTLESHESPERRCGRLGHQCTTLAMEECPGCKIVTGPRPFSGMAGHLPTCTGHRPETLCRRLLVRAAVAYGRVVLPRCEAGMHFHDCDVPRLVIGSNGRIECLTCHAEVDARPVVQALDAADDWASSPSTEKREAWLDAWTGTALVIGLGPNIWVPSPGDDPSELSERIQNASRIDDAEAGRNAIRDLSGWVVENGDRF